MALRSLLLVALLLVALTGLVASTSLAATGGGSAHGARASDLAPQTNRAATSASTGSSDSGAVLVVNGSDPVAASLGWNESTDPLFTSYEVEMSQVGPNGPWTEEDNITSVSTTQYVAEPLAAGTSYWFQVTTYDLAGMLAGEVVSNVVESMQPPKATLSDTSLNPQAVQLTWTNGASYGGGISFDQYVIEDSVNGSSLQTIATDSSPSNLTYTADGLSPGTSYVFTVQTEDSCCGGLSLNTDSNSAAIGTPTSVDLSAPGLDPVSAALAWTPASESGFDYYQVEISSGGTSGPWTSLANLTGESQDSFWVGQLGPGETYDFRVIDHDNLGVASSNVVDPTQPSVPALTAAAVNASSFNLTWNNDAVYGGGLTFSAYWVNESVSGGAYSTIAMITSESTLSYTVSGLSSGTGYSFQIVVVDGDGGAHSSHTPSNVATVGTPDPVTVTAQESPSSTDVGQLVSFSCAASGGVPPYTYSWTFGDGASASGQVVSHAYSTAGTYQATCTATDLDLLTATGTASEVVSADPTVSISVASAQAAPGTPLTFTAEAQGGPGTFPTYTWSFGDGASGSGPSATHAYNQSGTFTVSLTVVDANGGTATASLGMTLETLVVTAEVATVHSTPGVPFRFSASAVGGSGSSYTYSWNFGDGTSGSGNVVSHAYLTPGAYVATVTVTDGLGETNLSSSPSVLVFNAIGLTLGISIRDPVTGETVSMSAEVSGGSGDFTCSWQFGDGTTGNACTETHSWDKAGTYSIYLIVDDPSAGTASADSSVKVSGPTVHDSSAPSTLSTNLRWILLAVALVAGVIVLWAVLHRRPSRPPRKDEPPSSAAEETAVSTSVPDGVKGPSTAGSTASPPPVSSPPSRKAGAKPATVSPTPSSSSKSTSTVSSRSLTKPAKPLPRATCPNCGRSVKSAGAPCPTCQGAVLGE